MSEINRVVYDSEKVSVEQLAEWLRQAGTYIRTISGDENSGPDN